MESGSVVMIVAKPGLLRTGFQALLSSIPAIQAVGVVEDQAAVSQWNDDHHPSIVLIAANGLGDQAWSILEQVKLESPLARCLMIVENVEQLQESGIEQADAVFLEGSPPDEFVHVVEMLIEQAASGNQAAGA